VRSRAYHLREIVGHLDDLVDDLDDADASEADAKARLRAERDRIFHMLGATWAKKGET
jgi:hypothetical protein